MASLRVFISSTFSDLHQVRASLSDFLESQGYDAVKFERGDIPYDGDHVDKNCYKEIANCDVIICMISRRYGTSASERHGSITLNELKEAVALNKLIYIFIDNNILVEYETFKLNGDKVEKWSQVDDVGVYHFIEEIETLGTKMVITPFSMQSPDQIALFLRRQFSSHLHEYVTSRNERKVVNLIGDLQRGLSDLRQVAEVVKGANVQAGELYNELRLQKHPAFTRIRDIREAPVIIPFYTRGDFDSLLRWLGMNPFDYDPFREDHEPERWKIRPNSKWAGGAEELHVRTDKLFDHEGKLINMGSEDWNDEWISLYQEYNPFAD